MSQKPSDKAEFAHFRFALIVISLAILIPSIAFISENREADLVGSAASALQPASNEPALQEFDTVDSLGALAEGEYYIDDAGIIYWMDDSSIPPIAKVSSIEQSQKNRHIYIDGNGNVGYLI